MVNNEYIYAEKVDGTEGIIIVDPNSVKKNGVTEYRYVKSEDLMIYVSVQAQINSKTQIYNEAEGTRVINVASGKFYNSTAKNIADSLKMDVLNNTDTSHFTTAWSDMYDANKPADVEGFGITNIDIEINASLVPKIHIEFIDVRGKNLVERGDDLSNPYNVFYIFPYPLFQLTVKGYFGKAIQLPLVMEKAVTKFDPTSGSYIISADFKSFTFAMLNDAVLLYALLVDKMYQKPDGTFYGKDIVDRKYQEYYKTKQGQQDIEEMKNLGYANVFLKSDNTEIVKPLDQVVSLYRMFMLSDEMGTKLYKDELLSNTKLRGQSVNAFLEHLRDFKYAISSLSNNINNEKRAVVEQLVDSANSFFSAQKNNIQKLIDSEISADVFNVVLLVDTYVSENGEIIPMTDDEYNKIKDQIITFERARQDEDAKKFKDKFITQFNFYPSVKNIVKAVVIHIDAFMELLREKSEGILAKVTNDTDKKDPSPTYEVIQNALGDYRRMPWPEFYERENSGDGLVKAYPGNGTSEQQLWGEVEFIDEMFKASQRLGESLNEAWNGGVESAKNVFLLTPLSVPDLLPNLNTSKTDPVTFINRLFQQILDCVFHNGLLYKNMKDGDLFQDGIYDIMMKNVIKLINEELKSTNNGWNTLNLLKNQLASVSSSTKLAEYVNRNMSAFDKEPSMKGSSISNHLKFIYSPHGYSSSTSFNTGNADFDHFKTIYRGSGDKNKFGIQQLPYLGSWESTLDLTSFNTPTKLIDSPTSALTFTNNYLEQSGDIFITRPII